MQQNNLCGSASFLFASISAFFNVAVNMFATRGPWSGDKTSGKNFGFGDMRFVQLPGKYLWMLWWAVMFIILVLWLSTGFYVVDPDQEGVEMRFGRYSNTTMPGLHYHLPFPIEDVVRISVTSVQRMEIGYRSPGDNRDRVGDSASLEQESLMLTKDENIVDTNFEIQWKIKDVKSYLFNFRYEEVNTTVKDAAESAVREVIGKQGVATLLEGAGRAMLAEELQTYLQKLFDTYEMGIHIVSIQIKKVDPPSAVIEAFRDVQSARADKERAVNLGHAYANDIVPRARGAAAAVVYDAEAYRDSLLHTAQGEAQRFLLTYSKYKEAKEVVREKIYLETMQDTLENMNKIIIDKQGSSMYYLPLSDLLKHKLEIESKNDSRGEFVDGSKNELKGVRK